MELIDQDFDEKELNFAEKIKTNQENIFQTIDSETQPRTRKQFHTIESNGPISIVSSTQNNNILNINLITNNQTKHLKFLTQYKNICSKNFFN